MCQTYIRTKVRNVSDSHFYSLKQSIYEIIDNTSNSDDAKKEVDIRVNRFRKELSHDLQNVIGTEVSLMKKKIEQKKKELKGIDGIRGCNFTIPLNYYLDIDMDDALEELDVNLDDIGDFLLGTAGMAATGAAIGSVVPGLGTAIGAVAGGVLGFVTTSVKKITGDGGRGSAKNEAAKVLGNVKSQAMSRIMQNAENVIANLQKTNKGIRTSIDAEIKRLDEMDSVTERIKQQLNIYVGKLKITEYGTI